MGVMESTLPNDYCGTESTLLLRDNRSALGDKFNCLKLFFS